MTITLFFPPQWDRHVATDWAMDHANALCGMCDLFGKVMYSATFKVQPNDGNVLIAYNAFHKVCPVCRNNQVGSSRGETRSSLQCIKCGFEVEAVGDIADAYDLWNMCHEFVKPVGANS